MRKIVIPAVTAALVVPAALLILSAIALAGNSYNPFMYTRF